MIKCKLCDKPATHLMHCEEHYVCADCGTHDGLITFCEGVLCEACKAARVLKRITEFSGNTKGTGEVICPHCGYVHGDSWEMSEGTRECVDCGRSFEMEREVSVYYSTRKV